MKVVILYRPKSDHGGRVEDYAREYQKLHDNRQLGLVSLDSEEGAQMAKHFDVTSYPAVLAIAADGSLQKLWQAEQLPVISELDLYFQG